MIHFKEYIERTIFILLDKTLGTYKKALRKLAEQCQLQGFIDTVEWPSKKKNKDEKKTIFLN